MKRRFNEMLTIGLAGTLIFGSFFLGGYLSVTSGNKNIWWTPMDLAISLDASRTAFELYIQNDTIQKHIEKGKLYIADEKGTPVKVTSDDVKIRLNNWPRVKADRLNGSMLYAFLSGASLAVLIMGMIRWVRDKAS